MPSRHMTAVSFPFVCFSFVRAQHRGRAAPPQELQHTILRASHVQLHVC